MVCKITIILTTTQINRQPKELKELSIVVAAAERRAAAAAPARLSPAARLLSAAVCYITLHARSHLIMQPFLIRAWGT